jgi:hypothetical protein
MSGADPLTVVFSWTSAFATIGIVGLQFLVSTAVIVFSGTDWISGFGTLSWRR